MIFLKVVFIFDLCSCNSMNSQWDCKVRANFLLPASKGEGLCVCIPGRQFRILYTSSDSNCSYSFTYSLSDIY